MKRSFVLSAVPATLSLFFSMMLLSPLQAAADADLNGHILLQVEERGEAWYVDPRDGRRLYLADGTAAYELMRSAGLGILDADLALIPIGVEKRHEDPDYDGDGLPDVLEMAIGTEVGAADSDADGYTDGVEIQNGYSPLGPWKIGVDKELQKRLSGRILLQVEQLGEAWYVNPTDGRRYYLRDGDRAYGIMKYQSLGITNRDLEKIKIKTTTDVVEDTKPSPEEPPNDRIANCDIDTLRPVEPSKIITDSRTGEEMACNIVAIQFDEGVGCTQRTVIASTVNGTIVGGDRDERLYEIELAACDEATVYEAINKLTEQPGIMGASPEYITETAE